MTDKEKAEIKAEEFVRNLLKDVFKQHTDAETIRTVAKKVASATYTDPTKKAA